MKYRDHKERKFAAMRLKTQKSVAASKAVKECNEELKSILRQKPLALIVSEQRRKEKEMSGLG